MANPIDKVIARMFLPCQVKAEAKVAMSKGIPDDRIARQIYRAHSRDYRKYGITEAKIASIIKPKRKISMAERPVYHRMRQSIRRAIKDGRIVFNVDGVAYTARDGKVINTTVEGVAEIFLLKSGQAAHLEAYFGITKYQVMEVIMEEYQKVGGHK